MTKLIAHEGWGTPVLDFLVGGQRVVMTDGVPFFTFGDLTVSLCMQGVDCPMCEENARHSHIGLPGGEK